MRSERELQTGKGRAETGREKRGRGGGGSLDILWVRDLRHLRFETQNKPHKNKSKIIL